MLDQRISIVLFRGRPYKVMNGTYYNFATTDDMVIRLERIREYGLRVRFHWGDVETGQDWGDIFDVTGTLGRTAGPIKAPILLYNKRSIYGHCILDHCIVKITRSAGKGVLYQHPQYKEPV